MKNNFFHRYCPKGVQSKYELMVFDDEFKPFIPLTDYYAYLMLRVSKGTALTYIVSLEPYFYWLKHYESGDEISWDASPYYVQISVRKYLQLKLNCKVRDHNDFEKVYITKQTTKSVNVFLSALKGFYKFTTNEKIYKFENPLHHTNWNNNFVEFKGEREKKPRVAKFAGTENPIETNRKSKYLSNSYFKMVNDDWNPEINGDTNLPYKIYKAADRISASLRDQVVIRLLFETGARISEILGLTVSDYHSRSDRHEALTFNKGSHLKRIKYLKFSPETLKLLIRYINSERIKYAESPNKFNLLKNDEFLFLTQRGTQYSYTAFMKNWNKIMKSAEIKLNPHKARHWFVTNMLKSIYETSNSNAEIEDKKKQLIEYMKWKDKEVINVYEHYFDYEKFADIHHNMMKNYFTKEPRQTKKNGTDKKVQVEVQEEQWITELFDEMGED
jgi:site-specific recombinase XerD